VSEIESQIWRAAIGHLREHAGCINATSSAITKALQASGFICEALASSRVQQRFSQPLLKKCHQKKSSESATTETPLTNAAHSARPPSWQICESLHRGDICANFESDRRAPFPSQASPASCIVPLSTVPTEHPLAP
jgi:hypothetical protein